MKVSRQSVGEGSQWTTQPGLWLTISMWRKQTIIPNSQQEKLCTDCSDCQERESRNRQQHCWSLLFLLLGRNDQAYLLLITMSASCSLRLIRTPSQICLSRGLGKLPVTESLKLGSSPAWYCVECFTNALSGWFSGFSIALRCCFPLTNTDLQDSPVYTATVPGFLSLTDYLLTLWASLPCSRSSPYPSQHQQKARRWSTSYCPICVQLQA